MSYPVPNSPADFEDLVRDLIGRELNMRLEAFSAAPDGGTEGRDANDPVIRTLQAKHSLAQPYTHDGKSCGVST